MKKTEVLWATGISECRKRGHFERWKKLCKKRGKKVEVFHVGDMMFDQGDIIQRPLSKKNVLDADPWILDERKATIFEKIRRLISENTFDAILIADHLSFYWRSDFMEAHASFGYASILDPKKFFCFVDGPGLISQRLGKNKQWKDQGLDIAKTILWQSTEMILTKNLALNCRAPWFVLPSMESEEVLYELVFNPRAELFFAMVPITSLIGEEGEKDRKEIHDFLNDFRKIYPAVVNPYTIEVGTIDTVGFAEEALALHTHVLNLNDRFIEQANSGIVFMPRVVISDGIGYEQPFVFRRGKNVFAVHPEQSAGPHKVRFATEIFKNKEDCLKFFKQRKSKK